MCSSVDLPEPDGPMMAVKLPGAKATSTPRRASTADVPVPKRLTMSWPRTTAVCAGAGAAPGTRSVTKVLELMAEPSLARAREATVITLVLGRGELRRQGAHADAPPAPDGAGEGGARRARPSARR